ncbi:MAG: N-acetylmuramoyl-L-alanine amidase, partial [Acidimicrobiales bacterium]|nr:N-acetylmuramoyl-L-alanine amidase [Acidimicrobiales bacterium]
MFRTALSVALLSLGLVVPSIGLAEGMTTLEDGSPPSSAIITADLPEVEAAIEAAAAEFGVPLPILQAIAHTESRWQHHPTRLSMGGRQGLFQLTQDRRELGAALLEVTDSAVRQDVATHARAFAMLLDFQRPQPEPSWMAFADIGLWRDAIIFALDLPVDFADRYVDRLFMLVAKGLIARLPSGEPIGFAPSPIDGQHLGLWSESTERNPDYWAAIWNPTSCNYSNANRSVGDVDMVIIHTVQGSYSGCISWFHNCASQVSAHYVVSTTGEITQVVDEIDVGWHVRDCNWHTIGIEHEGYVDDPALWYTDAMYSASAGLTADILADWGLPADRNSVQGHDEVGWLCNTNHSDPGSGWDWDYYMSLVGGPPEPEGADLVGFIRHTDLFEPANGIAGAVVDLDGVGAVMTDSTGFYTFDELDPGTYSICARASGYVEGCRTKTVELNAVNWGSILLEADTGDDDDTTTDDDDTTTDDDDTTTDDDDSGE